MTAYSDLELAIRKREKNSYAVSLRFNAPDDEAEQRTAKDPAFKLNLSDLTAFGPLEYGEQLGRHFYTPELKAELKRYRSLAQKGSSILRVRLSIEPSAGELHEVRWETLRNPADPDNPWFMGGDPVVSRFLASSLDSEPVHLRARTNLRVLVVVANPKDLDEDLKPVNVSEQRDAAVGALKSGGQPIHIDHLGEGGEVLLDDIRKQLLEGYDILYLVCHGQLLESGPIVWLEDKRPSSGIELVNAMQGLPQRPRLVVLASCESGAEGAGLSGLGPRLADSGIPAVIAMQGSIDMKTAKEFMRSFFMHLMVDGQIDRAMSEARNHVRDRKDWWMPALFMRLRGGRIWYEPGFAGSGQSQLKCWKSICENVHAGKFVPIIGPELAEELFGGTRDLAKRLADSHGFPMASHERTDLSKVTQFIMAQQKSDYTAGVVERQFLQRISEYLGVEFTDFRSKALRARVRERLSAEPGNPFSILAGLKASIYFNAGYSPLLYFALDDHDQPGGRKPEIVTSPPWRIQPGDAALPEPKSGSPSPTPAAPWDYHPFGVFPFLKSLVLTEDDFLDYLIATSRLRLMPEVLTSKLTESSLLFVGFRLDDWRFRYLMRLILSIPGSVRMKGFSHVGVQVNPDDQSMADAQAARGYMETYFGGNEISIYWGSSSDFLRELEQRMDEFPEPSAEPVPANDQDDWVIKTYA